MAIYFLQGKENAGLIKIGYSATPQKRVKGIQRMSPEPLNILAIIEGDRKKEAAIHSTFAHLRQHGEWFTPAVELLTFIGREPSAAQIEVIESIKRIPVPVPVTKIVFESVPDLVCGKGDCNRDAMEGYGFCWRHLGKKKNDYLLSKGYSYCKENGCKNVLPDGGYCSTHAKKFIVRHNNAYQCDECGEGVNVTEMTHRDYTIYQCGCGRRKEPGICGPAVDC